MQERAKHGLEQLLRQAMDTHKDSGSGTQTARNAFEVFAEVQEMSDEGISHIWPDYVETEQLWDMFGRLEAFKTIVDYEHVVEPARVLYSVTVGRKDRARAKIKVHWGEHWEEEFEPQEFHLRQFSKYFQRHLAAIAKDGRSMQQAWKAIDAGCRLRIQDRSSGQHKTRVFTAKDLLNAAKWLTQAADGKASKQEVPEEDLVNA
jgi:hypothetical protein